MLNINKNHLFQQGLDISKLPIRDSSPFPSGLRRSGLKYSTRSNKAREKIIKKYSQRGHIHDKVDRPFRSHSDTVISVIGRISKGWYVEFSLKLKTQFKG